MYMRMPSWGLSLMERNYQMVRFAEAWIEYSSVRTKEGNEQCVLMQRRNTRIRSLASGAKRRTTNGTQKRATTTCQGSRQEWHMGKTGKNLAKEENQTSIQGRRHGGK
ncbi:uncharacterized protein LOC127645482 isoform X1 [Xyrauchen texanus]|uniref:uncharacterized protein LOC127645482 isoform X1 n=1 Tax=Xyrauchen texanus TaxID=154827 RepID=UPI0022424971|nr:uncharacterized protein LOC127645482 isoform X1 [Xyrauchen texanus]